MKLFSRVRRLFLCAALVSTLMLSGAFHQSSRVGSAPLVCNPQYSTWVTYYSDATYTVEIGYRYIQCNGTGTLYGSSSSYQQSEIIDVCCRDPGGNGCVPC
jgi:hypothetical protein